MNTSTTFQKASPIVNEVLRENDALSRQLRFWITSVFVLLAVGVFGIISSIIANDVLVKKNQDLTSKLDVAEARWNSFIGSETIHYCVIGLGAMACYDQKPPVQLPFPDFIPSSVYTAGDGLHPNQR